MGKQKWEVTGLLWSPSQNRYIQPGEIVELPDDLAKRLFDLRVIKPAVYRRINKSREVKNGSDN